MKTTCTGNHVNITDGTHDQVSKRTRLLLKLGAKLKCSPLPDYDDDTWFASVDLPTRRHPWQRLIVICLIRKWTCKR